MKWILYVNHPMNKKESYRNIYDAKTLGECVDAAKWIIAEFNPYIVNRDTDRKYDRFGKPMEC